LAFKDDKSSLEELNSQLDEVSAQMEELSEEHSGDEGLLEDAKTEAGNLSKTSINARLKDKSNPPDEDELKVLKQYLQLLNLFLHIFQLLQESAFRERVFLRRSRKRCWNFWSHLIF